MPSATPVLIDPSTLRPGAGLHPQTRTMLDRLERQYAAASAAEWDELAAHMEDRMMLMPGGAGGLGGAAGREAMRVEFDRIRTNALVGRCAPGLLAQLTDGGAQLAGRTDDGLQEAYQVTARTRTTRHARSPSSSGFR